MKKLFVLIATGMIYVSCNHEEDHDHDNTTDTTAPVISLTSPNDSSIYYNGDTVFISGMVTDNEMHEGIILIKDDTTLTEYFNQTHYVHELSSAQISFQYIVSGITQNSAATLTLTYEDHAPNYGVATRKLIFKP